MATLSNSARAVLQVMADGAALVESRAVGVFCYLTDPDHRPLPGSVRYPTVVMFLKRGWIKATGPAQGFPYRTEYKITDEGRAALR